MVSFFIISPDIHHHYREYENILVHKNREREEVFTGRRCNKCWCSNGEIRFLCFVFVLFLYFVYFFCKCFLPLSSFVMSSLVLSKPKGARINKANINIYSFKGVKRNSARHQAQVTDMKTMEIVLIMKMMTRTISMTISRTMTMTSNNTCVNSSPLRLSVNPESWPLLSRHCLPSG